MAENNLLLACEHRAEVACLADAYLVSAIGTSLTSAEVLQENTLCPEFFPLFLDAFLAFVDKVFGKGVVPFLPSIWTDGHFYPGIVRCLQTEFNSVLKDSPLFYVHIEIQDIVVVDVAGYHIRGICLHRKSF